jgi:hypothetical protein
MSETTVKAIHKKVLAYHKKFNAIAGFLKNNTDPAKTDPNLAIEKDKEPIQFYIDKESVGKLMQIALLDNFDSFAVLFGLEDCDSGKAGQITACFLGVDENKNILPQHLHATKNKQGKEIKMFSGQNTWPPPPPPPGGSLKTFRKGNKKPNNYFTLNSNEKDIKHYFSIPKSKK